MPETIGGLSTHAIGIWLAALLTLAIYSFLYRDNPLYKFAEHLFVGTSAGYAVGLTWNEVIIRLVYKPLFQPAAVGLLEPNWAILVPTLLGIMMFFRFSRRYGWLARWPLCFVMGYGAGIGIPGAVQNILDQTRNTMVPLAPYNSGAHTYDWFAGLSALVMVVAVVSTLCYFYFSKEHKGALGVGGRVGIYFLMIAFGAGFGNTVMARISLLIGRIQFLIENWIPLITGLLGGR
ncbi:MAG: hypothetical protein ACUVX8_00775 [Candidatus Zipacnadales bacterium]